MPDYGIINDRSPHIIADLCELICLCEATSVSRGDIESYINTKGGAGLLTELSASDDTQTNERIQALTEDAFQHLIYRQNAFKHWYPYVVSHDVIEVKDSYTDHHRIYASLLIQSRLKMLPRADRFRLASEFEALCREALPGLLPAWRIYHFGANGRDRHLFGHKLKDALRVLAGKLKDGIIEKRVNELSEHDVGDAGIDLVGMYEWQDDAESIATYFCQCAAQQTGWPEKRFEASPLSLERYFSFFHKPGTVLMIPVCYRIPSGQWLGSDGHQSILVDRLRLVELMDNLIDGGAKGIEAFLATVSQPIEPGAFLQSLDTQAAA